MDKLKLIHNKDKFLLEIDDAPIHNVSYYKIESEAGNLTELTLKLSIDMSKSSIDIDNEEVKLR